MVKNRYMARGVSKYDIADFIRELKIPYVNRKFDTQGLSEYIENSDIFHLWDVVIATGESDVPFKGKQAATRSFHVSDNETFIRIGAGNNRVLDPGILDSGLTDSEKDKFTCKKELYNYFLEDNLEYLNKEDYFEMGTLCCKNVKKLGIATTITMDIKNLNSSIIVGLGCFSLNL